MMSNAIFITATTATTGKSISSLATTTLLSTLKRSPRHRIDTGASRFASGAPVAPLYSFSSYSSSNCRDGSRRTVSRHANDLSKPQSMSGATTAGVPFLIRSRRSTHDYVDIYSSYRRLFSSSSSLQMSSSSSSVGDNAEWYVWGTNKNGYLNSLIEDSENQGQEVPKEAKSGKEAAPDVLWEPKQVTWAPNDGTNGNNTIKSIVCGPTSSPGAGGGGSGGGKHFATVVVMENGDVYVSGDNTYGYLGVGHDQPVPKLTKLESIDDGEGGTAKIPPISKVVLGSSPSMALISQDGDLYTCGFNGDMVTGSGWLGHGTNAANAANYTLPKRVESLVEDGCYVDDVVAGENHMTVLTTEGEVLTCGICSYGRLGNGETHGVDQLYLEPVEVLPNDNNIISQISGGKSFTLALHSKEGVIYGWGRNHKGQLGTGFGMAVDMYSMENVPTPMDSSTDILLNQKVVSMSCGPSHAACVTEARELYIWGMGTHLEPHKVTQVLHTPIVNVYCGGNDTTVAVSEDGQLYIWGNHGKKTGMLGLSHEKVIQSASNTTLRHQPQLLRSLAVDHFVHDVSVGTVHMAAKCTTTNSGGDEGATE